MEKVIRQLRLFTLSPLHIGTGETLSPMDYVIDGKTFYRIQQEELYGLVRSSDFPNGARRLKEWTQEQFHAMRDLRDNRAQSQLMNRINALTFFRKERQEQRLLAYLQQRSPKGQKLILDDDNRRTGEQQLGEVREAIRTRTDHQPYLPGSSLKGALRTALLFDYLQRHGDIQLLEPMIKAQLKDRRTRKEYFANPLEAEVFFCAQREKLGRDGQGSKYRTRTQEAQMDLLKFISVSDAHAIKRDSVQLEVGKINLYLIEKEKERNHQPTGRLIASRQGQSSYAEIIARGQELQSTISVNGTELAFLLNKAGKGSISVGDRHEYYLRLKQKLQRLFDLPDQVLDQPEVDKLEAAIADHCLTAIHRFSRAQLERQNDWQKDYGEQLDPAHYAERIASGFSPVHNYKGKLLHLGYASGFNATTVLMYFLRDQGHRILYERIMEEYGLGRAPRQKGQYVPKISRFPKSRRFVETATSIQPLGWLAILEEGDPMPGLKNTGGMTTSHPAEAEPQEPVRPEFYTGKLNYKKPPELNAVVVKSGKPNRVKIYYTLDDSPEMELQGYRTSLDVGTVIIVKSQFNRKGKLLSASYRGKK